MRNFVFALLLLASCGSPQQQKPPVAVEVATAITKNVPVYKTAIGNVSGFLSIDVRTQVTGQIIAAHVKEGDWVKEGDLLFSIDPSLYRAALEKAKGTLAKDQALLELSKTKLERNAELVKKEFISKVIYDELKSNVESQEGQVAVDQADVDVAQINLNRTKIYAFSSGKIGRFNFDVGNIVSPTDQKPLTNIEYIDEVYVNVSLPEKDFDEISAFNRKQNLPFIVTLEDDVEIGKGTVVFLDNNISSQTGTFLIRGRASNPQKLMWPGQFVRVRLILDDVKDAVLVPEKAIQISQKGPLIWIVNDDMTVKSLPVELGEHDKDWVIIKKGLKAGQKVVTLGQTNLREGFKVFIPEKNP